MSARLAAGAVIAALVSALSACSGPAVSAGSATPSTAQEEALQPVIAENFPDPDVLAVDGGYYAYSTESNRRNVPVAFSEDLTSWAMLDDALPEIPEWVIPGKTWAPEVAEIAPGEYAMYFTATNFDPTLQCIGVAVASDPAGPFEVHGDGMLVCPPDEGGAIDATTVRIGETLHLVWKNDGNAIGVDTWVQSAPLSADGLSLVGEPQRLIKQDQAWEGDVVEAPTVVPSDSGLTLVYSANSYGADDYGIGYATAKQLSGPWAKAPGPWVSTQSLDGQVSGPGGQDVVTGPDGRSMLVFHGWDRSFTYRMMYVTPLEWSGLEPVIEPHA